MMQSFAESKAAREVIAEASDVLKQDLWKLMAEGPAEELNSTLNTQPVMLTAGYATYRAWREAGGADPALLAGRSLGEYTALVVSGTLAFRDALPLVRFRAQAMQEAVPVGEGAMAAILGLEDDAMGWRTNVGMPGVHASIDNGYLHAITSHGKVTSPSNA